MEIWQRIPAIRFVLPFVLGVLIAHQNLVFLSSGLVVVAFVLSVISCWFLSSRYSQALQSTWALLTGFTVQISFFLLGVCAIWFHNPKNESDYVGFAPQAAYLKIRVVEPLRYKQGSYRFLAETQATIDTTAKITRSASGLIQLYVKCDSAATPPYRYGDVLLIPNQLVQIPSPKNPQQFDYAQYMSNRGVWYMCFLPLPDVVNLQLPEPNWILQKAYATKQYFQQQLATYIHGKQELSIAQALTVGYTYDIDSELMQQYANSGVLHVLSVSGMHVAAIFWLLSFCLTRLNTSKRLRPLNLAIMLLFLWFYALLCGFSSPVVRSACMLSLLQIGIYTGRRHNSVHIILLSALLLLVYNPYWLYDVGFQLSYMAILGLVILYKPLHRQWVFDHPVSQFLYSTCCASVAAQLGTLPLALYYFHQFPNYFLLANIPAVFLSTAALYLSMGIATLGFIPWLGSVLGLLAEYVIKLLNITIGWIDTWPLATWNGIYISGISAAVLYLLIAFGAAFLLFKQVRLLYCTLICVIILGGIYATREIERTNQSGIYVYSQTKKPVIHLIQGSQQTFISDTRYNLSDTKAYQYAIKNHLDFRGLNNRSLSVIPADSAITTSYFSYHEQVLLFGTEVFVIWQRPMTSYPSKMKGLILINNHFDPADLPAGLQLEQIIVATYLSKDKQQRLAAFCKQHHIQLHTTYTQGYWCFRA